MLLHKGSPASALPQGGSRQIAPEALRGLPELHRPRGRDIVIHDRAGAGWRRRHGALAGLEELWDAPIAWDDPPALHRLERGLVEAEVKLSAYRRALHERIDACTAQLVDHYQRDPAQIVR